MTVLVTLRADHDGICSAGCGSVRGGSILRAKQSALRTIRPPSVGRGGAVRACGPRDLPPAL